MFVSRASWLARSSPDGSGPTFEDDDLVFSDFLNIFFFSAIGFGAADAHSKVEAFSKIGGANLIVL